MYNNPYSKKRYLKFISFILIVSFIVLLINDKPYYASSPRPKATEIPIGSLIIGSHIISLKALTTPLLEIAQKSASDTGQNKIYYKSEFTNGTWYDITTSSGFTDISTDGKPVPDNLIDSLNLTHWTKDDCVTIEFSTGIQGNILTMINNLDTKNYPELAEIRKQLEFLEKNPYPSDDDKNQITSICEVLSPLQINEYEALKHNMEIVSKYIKYLKNVRKETEQVILIPQDILEILNNQILLYSYKEIDNKLQKAILYANSVISKNVDGDRLIIKPAYTDLSIKYSTALDAVKKVIAELENKLEIKPTKPPLDEKTTPVSPLLDENIAPTPVSPLLDEKIKAIKSLLKKLSTSENFEEADKILLKINSINNITSDIIANSKDELSILKPLRDKKIKDFISLISFGDSEKYKSAKSNNASSAVLLKLKKENMDEIKESIGYVQELTDYITIRLESNEEVVNLLSDFRKTCLESILKLPKSDLKEDLTNYINSLLDKLNKDIASQKVDGSSNSTSEKAKELETIENQIKLLNNKYLDAVEKGQFETASELESSINELAKMKVAVETSMLDTYKGLLNEKNQLNTQLNIAKGKYKEALEKGEDNGEFINLILDIQSKLDKVNVGLLTNEALLDEKDKLLLKIYAETLEKLKAALTQSDNSAITIAEDLKGIASELYTGENKLKDDFADISELIDSTKASMSASGASQKATELLELFNKVEKVMNLVNTPTISDSDKDKLFKNLKDLVEAIQNAINKGDFLDASIKASNLYDNLALLPVGLISDETLNELQNELNNLIDSINNNEILTKPDTATNNLNQSIAIIATAINKAENEIASTTPEENDNLNKDDVLSFITKTENSIGLSYPADLDLITDLPTKKHCLINRVLILEYLKNSTFSEVDSVKLKDLQNEYVNSLTSIEAEKYKEAELKNKYEDGYGFISLNNVIFYQGNYKISHPIAIKNNSIYISLRTIAAPIDARVLWKPTSKEAILAKGNTVLRFYPGNKTVNINGKVGKMEFAAENINNITYVQIDYITALLDLSYLWLEDSNTLILFDKALESKISTYVQKGL